MKRQGTVDDMVKYGTPRNGTLTKNDHEKAKQIGEKAKTKYISGKNQTENNKIEQ